MSMIVCPNCGKEVSEKARKCVHCGEILISEEKKHCVECGTNLEDGMIECPNCGCPVGNSSEQEINEKPQKVEVTGIRLTKKIKAIIGIVAAVLAVGVATIFGVTQYQKKKSADEYAQRVAEYSDNLELITYTMLSGDSTAETSGNLIKQVWSNAIYKKSDNKTDKYTMQDGYFVSDFNDALKKLFADKDFKNNISKIESNQDTVNSLMKELKNPPDEYKEAYEAVSTFYDAYITFTNLVTNPTGSLQTFSTNFNNADTKTSNSYDAMKLYLKD